MNTPKMNAGALAGCAAPAGGPQFNSMPKADVIKDKQISSSGGGAQDAGLRNHKPAEVKAGKRHPAKNDAGALSTY